VKVYIVFEGEYSDRGSRGVFSTREKAEAFIAEAGKIDGSDRLDIEEHTVDQQAEHVARDCWQCRIDYATGRIEPPPYQYREMADPNSRARIEPIPTRLGAWCYSYVSAEHCQKLAAEACQEWLRATATLASRYPNLLQQDGK